MTSRQTIMLSFLLVFGVTLSLIPWNDIQAQKSKAYYGELSKDNPLSLELGLKMYKKKFLLREPIRVRVSATNVGKDKGRFLFKTGDALVITDSKGELHRCEAHINRLGLNEIQPGETLEEEVDLTSYACGVSHNEFIKGLWYLPPEKYTISFVLHQTNVSGGYLFAESPVDTFEVVEPHGEDSLALELLLQSYDFIFEKNIEESKEKLREIIEKYPECGYIPYVMLREANTVEKWSEVIKKIPESGEAIEAVNKIASYFSKKKDKPGYIEAMNNLIKQYPDTDIAKTALRLKNIVNRRFRKRPKHNEKD